MYLKSKLSDALILCSQSISDLSPSDVVPNCTVYSKSAFMLQFQIH